MILHVHYFFGSAHATVHLDACAHTHTNTHTHTHTHTHIFTTHTSSIIHTRTQFNQLYEQAIDRSDKANMPSKRIHNIIEYMTYEIYLYIQRGLFERHKIIFALMLTNKVLCSAGKIKVRVCVLACLCVLAWVCVLVCVTVTQTHPLLHQLTIWHTHTHIHTYTHIYTHTRTVQPMDVDVFLKGGGALDINSVRKKPKDWIPDNVWLSIIALSFMVGLVCVCVCAHVCVRACVCMCAIMSVFLRWSS